MKKILAILSVIVLLSACVRTEEKRTIRERTDVQSHSYIIELEHHGTVHEFVYYTDGYGYRSGLAHWPDCKYCKEHEEN